MMHGPANIALVGATGAVGRTALIVLEQRRFPVGEFFAVASARSAGSQVEFVGTSRPVFDLSSFDFGKVDIALFSAGGEVSRQYAPLAAQAGAVVVDNTACFRYDADVPLVVPEVNPEAVAGYTRRRIIANPNCSTIQMVVALKPIYDRVGIERVTVSTYQAASGAGQKGVDELLDHSRRQLAGESPVPRVFGKPLPFNVVPHIDNFEQNGYTREEMKMVWETRKILGDDSIRVNPTAVRVPVVNGHSAALCVETRDKISAAECRAVLERAPGICIIDSPVRGGYPTALTDGAGSDLVYVGRIREDISHPRGICFWVVADNLRKGAATNSIQIAELLIKDYL